MKNAVMMPHAISAGMFGMIMPERNVPKRCTPTRRPPGLAADDVVVMMSSLSGEGLSVLREGCDELQYCSPGGCRIICGESGVGELSRLVGGASEKRLADVGEGGGRHRQAGGSEPDEH